MFSLIKSQPRALYILTLGELCERFSYYGMLTTLILFLGKSFTFDDAKSYTFYGAYTAFCFAIPVLGGIIADKLIGMHKALIYGAILIIVGNLLLIIPTYFAFCIGLAVIVCGIGLFKVNCTNLVSALYLPDDVRRETGFTLLYAGMNLGATLGGIAYGLTATYLGWHDGFIISALLMLIALICYLRISKYIVAQLPKFSVSHMLVKSLLFYIVICVAILSIGLILYHPFTIDPLFCAIGLITLIVMLRVAYQQPGTDRKKIFCILMLCFFSTCFFAASLQVGSSITLFINSGINRDVGGWTVPTMLFAALSPLSVIIMAPILAVLWQTLAKYNKELHGTAKILIGLLLAITAFICFIAATLYHTAPKSHLPIVWIIIGNLFLGSGEICLAPITIAMITKLAPAHLQSTLLGTWFLFIAFAGYASSLIAKLGGYIALHQTRMAMSFIFNSYSEIFLLIIIIIGAVILILLSLYRKINYIIEK